MLFPKVDILQKYIYQRVSYQFIVSLYSFTDLYPQKHNAQSCHGGVLGLQSGQEFGEISDYLSWTPHVHSHGKMSHSEASNMSKEEDIVFFFL